VVEGVTAVDGVVETVVDGTADGSIVTSFTSWTSAFFSSLL
jgi:hypothetical protein